MRLQQFDIAKHTPRFEQDAPGTLDQEAAGRRQRNPSGSTVEELHAYFVLKHLDTAAERGLAEMDAASRTGETSFFGKRDQMRKPSRIDFMHCLHRPDKENALELLRYTTSNGPDTRTGSPRYQRPIR
jgi:hypothetical protein